MTIEEIKDKIRARDYIISQHAFIESSKDKIEDEEIREAILSGKVIEEYIGDTRGRSLLVSGIIRNDMPLHVVIGVASDKPVVITVYKPSPPKWITPDRRGGRQK